MKIAVLGTGMVGDTIGSKLVELGHQVMMGSRTRDNEKAFPEAKVVKALNTMWCELMVNPAMINGGDHDTFICGNDSTAKENVKELLKSFGWSEKGKRRCTCPCG